MLYYISIFLYCFIVFYYIVVLFYILLYSSIYYMHIVIIIIIFCMLNSFENEMYVWNQTLKYIKYIY